MSGDPGVSSREAVLRRWVDQPPAAPVVQYLRDAEREAAIALLEGERVLDVASEAAVTRGVDAASVSRVDFSAGANALARDVLGETVDAYAATDPGDPVLPFADDAFDGAVSVGPFDWRFLDLAGLTAELRRVLAPDGTFVYTVPTERSPYARGARNRFRFYDPDDALEPVTPGWRVDAERSIYQLPATLHRMACVLPADLQRRLVPRLWRRTDRLDRAGDRGDASYLVVRARQPGYGRRLEGALEALFRPADDAGFWDGERDTILRAQRYVVGGGRGQEGAQEPDLAWTPERRTGGRYAPFALMGAMHWRASPRGDARHDDRLQAALSTAADRVADGGADALPSYGLGSLTTAFALASDVFGHSYLETARTLAAHGRERVAFDHSEDALVLYGWATLADLVDDPALEAAVDDAAWAIVDRQSPTTGRFRFDNPTSHRHQNQLYACWGLARAVEHAGTTGYLENLERALADAVATRMRPDGGFRWEDVGPLRRRGTEAFYAVGRERDVPHWELLFPCHQAFFVVAVHRYRRAGGDDRFDDAVRRAMSWIQGANPRGEDLVAASGIGVPLRLCTTDGRIDVPGQQFVGAYEVGAYAMALAALLQWTETADGS